MKKLALAALCAAVICGGAFTSCSNDDTQDVNVVDMESNEYDYLYGVTGTHNGYTISSGEGTVSWDTGTNSNYRDYEISVLYKYTDASSRTQTGYFPCFTIRKYGGKYYDKSTGTDVTEYFTSGDPESSTFTFSGTLSDTEYDLTLTRK